MDFLGLCVGLIFILGSISFGVGLKFYDHAKEQKRLKEMELSSVEIEEELFFEDLH